MDDATRVLVLGGTASGKSSFAEGLLADGLPADTDLPRYLATGRPVPDDPEWQRRIDAHRKRRDERWQTVECGDHPDDLVRALGEAPAGSSVLVDDVGAWVALLVTAEPEGGADAGARNDSRDTGGGNDSRDNGTGNDSRDNGAGNGGGDTGAGNDGGDAGAGDLPATDPEAVADRLVAAVRDCAARRVVLVSPEVGLSVVPDNVAARRFTDLLGACNRALAAAVESVALVVAGRVLWLPAGSAEASGGAAPAATAAAPAAAAPTAVLAVPADAAPEPMAEPEESGDDSGPDEAADDEAGAVRPPDRVAINAVGDRLVRLASGGAGLGALAEPVAWVAGATGHAGPWTDVRVVLVGGDHAGGASAGDRVAAERVAEVESGAAPLARLAERVGATVTVADLAGAGFTEPAPAMETLDVLNATWVDRAVSLGRELAGTAADGGAQLLVPAACGAGVEAAAAAVLAAATGSEPAGLLGRVVGEAGAVDDAAWIARCVAARDALHRVRMRARDARSLLGMLGGPDLAVLTGLVIGAAIRHVPVLVDNPASAAAMMLARDLAPSSPWWCLIPDHGDHPALRLTCDLLGIEPFLDLRLGLGDGTAALTAVATLQPALSVAEPYALREE